MKNLLIALVIAAPISGFAQVMTRNVYNCSYWQHQNGYYVCGSYPMMEQTVDAMSLNMKIQDLERRLAEVEKKLSQH